jgi:hypothetical protein
MDKEHLFFSGILENKFAKAKMAEVGPDWFSALTLRLFDTYELEMGDNKHVFELPFAYKCD